MNDPELFLRSNSASHKDGIAHLDELKDNVDWTSGEKILDVGCGPGDFTANILLPFVPHDASIVGCDISKNMIHFAKKNFQKERLTFNTMDIEDKNLWNSWSKETFSKIYSLYCMHWVHDTRLAQENMFSLLKPGGEIHLLFLLNHPIFDVLQEIMKLEKWTKIMKENLYFPMCMIGNTEERAEKYIEELKSVGFEDIEMSIKKVEHSYPSKENYLDLMMSVDPYSKHVPMEIRGDYSNDFKEATAKTATINPNNGEAVITYTIIAVRAKRKPASSNSLSSHCSGS